MVTFGRRNRPRLEPSTGGDGNHAARPACSSMRRRSPWTNSTRSAGAPAGRGGGVASAAAPGIDGVPLALGQRAEELDEQLVHLVRTLLLGPVTAAGQDV